MTLGARYGLTDMMIQPEEQGLQSMDQEYNVYITSSLTHPNTNPLMFWELEQDWYPTIFWMAMDYLPVQPSSLPCKQVFSSSGLTDTQQCNRVNCILMEALQILKFSFKKECPNLKWWTMLQQEMLYNEDSSQILATAIPGHDSGTVDEVLKAIMTEKGEELSHHVQLF